MSFSGTPLGQGRRLDHQTFLNKAPPSNYPDSPSPQRRVPNTNSIPLSYAYGAPTLGKRPTGKPSSGVVKPNSPTQSKVSPTTQSAVHLEELNEEEDEAQALARYARLKQRNEALSGRPGYSVGPGIITSPPKPNGANLKDTSVNIASAFHQAASSYIADTDNMNSSWQSQSRHLPRSTSVEYEKETQSTSHRRLAPPPNRVRSKDGHSKPPSKASSVQNDSGDAVEVNGRGKSPFEQISELTKRALAPATFFMRQRSHEPEEPQKNTDGTSYDYAAEEEEYQRSLKPSSMRSNNAAAQHKRNRMSMDNRAYRPTASELDEDSDYANEDEKKSKRKTKKKDTHGGPLTTLPVAGYSKTKRRKGRTSKGNAQDMVEDDDENVSDEQVDEQRSIVSANRQASVSRSIPPVSRGSKPPDEHFYDKSGHTDSSRDIESGLMSIPEVEEFDVFPPDVDIDSSRESANQSHSFASTSSVTRSTFSVGVLLGTLVNWLYRLTHGIIIFIFRLFAMTALLAGRLLGSLINLVILKPVIFIQRAGKFHFTQFGKYVIAALVLYLAWVAVQHPAVIQWSLSFQHPQRYAAPSAPPADISEFAARLLQLENGFATYQLEIQSSQSRVENDIRKQRDSLGRVGALESRLDREVVRAQKSEEDFRHVASAGIENLQNQVKGMQNQLENGLSSIERSTSDEEARSQLAILSSRLQNMEGGIQEAIDLSKNAASVSGPATASIPSWWHKFASGSASGVTIKSSDGQDITSLISYLVDTALSKYTKDDLALVDYALYSGGAQVIPSLTSATYEIKPGSITGYLKGFVTGGGFAIGRPPVTALHHELRLGHCWPFPGSKGFLGVSLSWPVHISSITIDHVAKEVSHDMRSAPRDMEIWGFVEGKDNLEKYKLYQEQKRQERLEAAERGIVLTDDEYPRIFGKHSQYMRIASFTYDIHSPYNIQTFAVPQEIQDLGIDFGVVVLSIKNNWGSEPFTCLYRMRVHGTRLNPEPLPEIPTVS